MAVRRQRYDYPQGAHRPDFGLCVTVKKKFSDDFLNPA
jgi:hypothetical protein